VFQRRFWSFKFFWELQIGRVFRGRMGSFKIKKIDFGRKWKIEKRFFFTSGRETTEMNANARVGRIKNIKWVKVYIKLIT
jgi:hypothetical protein